MEFPVVFVLILLVFDGVMCSESENRKTYLVRYSNGNHTIPVTVVLDYKKQAEYVINMNPRTPTKSVTFYDFAERTIAYKDMTNMECFIGKLTNESLQEENELLTHLTNPVYSHPKVLNLASAKSSLTPTEVRNLAGSKIAMFCGKMSAWLLQENRKRVRRQTEASSRHRQPHPPRRRPHLQQGPAGPHILPVHHYQIPEEKRFHEPTAFNNHGPHIRPTIYGDGTIREDLLAQPMQYSHPISRTVPLYKNAQDSDGITFHHRDGSPQSDIRPAIGVHHRGHRPHGYHLEPGLPEVPEGYGFHVRGNQTMDPWLSQHIQQGVLPLHDFNVPFTNQRSFVVPKHFEYKHELRSGTARNGVHPTLSSTVVSDGHSLHNAALRKQLTLPSHNIIETPPYVSPSGIQNEVRQAVNLHQSNENERKTRPFLSPSETRNAVRHPAVNQHQYYENERKTLPFTSTSEIQNEVRHQTVNLHQNYENERRPRPFLSSSETRNEVRHPEVNLYQRYENSHRTRPFISPSEIQNEVRHQVVNIHQNYENEPKARPFISPSEIQNEVRHRTVNLQQSYDNINPLNQSESIARNLTADPQKNETVDNTFRYPDAAEENLRDYNWNYYVSNAIDGSHNQELKSHHSLPEVEHSNHPDVEDDNLHQVRPYIRTSEPRIQEPLPDVGSADNIGDAELSTFLQNRDRSDLPHEFILLPQVPPERNDSFLTERINLRANHSVTNVTNMEGTLQQERIRLFTPDEIVIDVTVVPDAEGGRSQGSSQGRPTTTNPQISDRNKHPTRNPIQRSRKNQTIATWSPNLRESSHVTRKSSRRGPMATRIPSVTALPPGVAMHPRHPNAPYAELASSQTSKGIEPPHGQITPHHQRHRRKKNKKSHRCCAQGQQQGQRPCCETGGRCCSSRRHPAAKSSCCQNRSPIKSPLPSNDVQGGNKATSFTNEELCDIKKMCRTLYQSTQAVKVCRISNVPDC